MLIAPALSLTQLSIAQAEKSDLNQKLTLYTKPAVVRVVSTCQINYVWDPDPNKHPYGIKIPIDLSFVGTGFLINPNGYIVTSANVIESREDCEQSLLRNIKQKIENKYLPDKLLEDPYLRNPSLTNESFPDARIEDRYITFEKIKQQMKSETKKDYTGRWNSNGSLQTDIKFEDKVLFEEGYVLLPSSQNNPLINKNQKPFEVKKSGRDFGKATEINKDIAIIKVPLNDAPSLKLGDSSQVQIQDYVMAVGYPTAADFEKSEIESILEASVQEGRISNPNKQIQGGYPVLQIDIRSAKGSAGSPLVNKDGEVIGMIARSTNTESDTIPLAIPISTIQEFIRQSGAVNERGETDGYYREGLEAFWKGNYEEAETKFSNVKGLYPLHSEVDRLIGEINQIEADRWSKPWTNPIYQLILALCLGGGIVAAVAYFLLKRQSISGTAKTNSSGFPTKRSTLFTPPVSSLKLDFQDEILQFELYKDEHRLGRDPTWADLKVPASWEVMSRRHAILRKEGGNYRIYDGDGTKASVNKIWIDEDSSVDPKEGHLLLDETELSIGQNAGEQIKLTYHDSIRATRMAN
jgi:S1-C subfamily serine protease